MLIIWLARIFFYNLVGQQFFFSIYFIDGPLCINTVCVLFLLKPLISSQLIIALNLALGHGINLHVLYQLWLPIVEIHRG